MNKYNHSFISIINGNIKKLMLHAFKHSLTYRCVLWGKLTRVYFDAVSQTVVRVNKPLLNEIYN